jgi:hypothetical protein
MRRRLKEEVVYRADYKREELLELGLSPRFVDFVFLDPKPKQFRYLCDFRHSGWACFIPKDVSGIWPLWTCNSNVIALWMRRGRLEFIKLYHDDPEPLHIAWTEQGLLAKLFCQLLEAENWHDPEVALCRLRQAAEVAGFRHMDELNEWHKQNGAAPDFYERWDEFVESLPK